MKKIFSSHSEILQKIEKYLNCDTEGSVLDPLFIHNIQQIAWRCGECSSPVDIQGQVSQAEQSDLATGVSVHCKGVQLFDL